MSNEYYFDRTGYIVIVPKSGNNAQAITIRNLRFTFNVKRTLSSNTNNPDISTVNIYNLSNETKGKINETDQFIQIYAGYNEAEGAKLIYTGDIISINHSRESVNTVSSIEAQDGGKAIREQRTSVSYGANTNVKQIIKDAISSFGLPIKIPVDKLNIPNIKISNSEAFTGNTKTILDKYVAKAGYQWTVINNEVSLIPIEETDNSRAVVLRHDTGLIDIPKKTNLKVDGKERNGWEIKSLLQPSLQIGGPVIINSAVVNSNAPFKILELYHTGDTHGNVWTSAAKVIAL